MIPITVCEHGVNFALQKCLLCGQQSLASRRLAQAEAEVERVKAANTELLNCQLNEYAVTKQRAAAAEAKLERARDTLRNIKARLIELNTGEDGYDPCGSGIELIATIDCALADG